MIRTRWIAGAMLAAGFSSAAHAGYIETSFTIGMTTQVSGATVYDFDTGAKPTGYSGEGWILPSSVSGIMRGASAVNRKPSPRRSDSFWL